MKHPFRLKDIKTGLYYCPVREIKVNGRYIKSNLSKRGKVYFTDPRRHIGAFDDHTQVSECVIYPYYTALVRTDIESLIPEEIA